MSLLDENPPPPTSALADGAVDTRDGSPPTVDRNRSSKRWALLAAVLCPCHLWLVAGVIGFFGAGATAEAIRDNQLTLAMVLAPLTAFALWRAVAAGRSAVSMSRRGASCPPSK